MKRVFIAIALWLMASPAWANSDDPSRSDYWLDLCDEQKLILICSSYINGYHNALYYQYTLLMNEVKNGFYEDEQKKAIVSAADHINGFMQSCVPEGVDYRQLVAVWMKFLRNNPERYHHSPASTYAESVREAFPCN